MGDSMSKPANFSSDCDLVAIGGGTGGLVTAAGAAYLGLRPTLVEKSALGGDCLWTGCVPSKALIASARLAWNIDHAARLGLGSGGARSEFRTVMERMRAARATVAHHDDPERFRSMGVSVHFGSARFLDASTLEVEGVGRIRSKRFVIATGAVAAIPPIPGLEDTDYWTYETVFDQDELPGSIVILGGGPIGLEFAQVFARLGSRVTVLEMAPTILIREDPDAAAFMHRLLEAEGIDIRVGAAATAVRTEAAKNRGGDEQRRPGHGRPALRGHRTAPDDRRTESGGGRNPDGQGGGGRGFAAPDIVGLGVGGGRRDRGAAVHARGRTDGQGRTA